MICESCKKCNDCKLSETFLAIKDIIRINECDDYEPNEESEKVIDIFGYKAKKKR